MCIYIYIYVYIYIYIYIHIYIYIYIDIYIRVYGGEVSETVAALKICIHMYACASIRSHASVYMYIHTCTLNALRQRFGSK